MATLRKFDAYAKTLEDFRIRTAAGGIVTIVSAAVITILLVSEWLNYMHPRIDTRLEVDSGRKERMDIHLNITFPYLPCAILSLDVMDVAGEHQNEISHDVFKVRLDKSGKRVDVAPEKEVVSLTQQGKKGDVHHNDPKYCGPCYGAKEGCCNTCKEVEDAYLEKKWSFKDAATMEQCVREGYVQAMKDQSSEGCLFYGQISVNKVPGNFHFAPGRSYEESRFHIHDISSIPTRSFDFSHYIDHLSFGSVGPGMINPLDRTNREMAHDKMFMIQNFVKVVGTRYYYLNGSTVNTNQYSVTEFARDVTNDVVQRQNAIPGLFFHYDISPMVVTHEEQERSLSYFLTSLCAVVGGVFTVAGLIDAALYRAARTLREKTQLGKTA